MSESYLIFARLSQASILLPCFIAILRFRNLGRAQRLIATVIWISTLTEVIARIIIDYSENPSTLPVYHVYVVFYFIVVNRLYKQVLSTKYISRLIDVLLVVFVGFSIMNSILWQPFSELNSSAIVLSNLIYITMSIFYYHELLSIKNVVRIDKNPLFWFNTGLILYNSGALFLFLVVFNFMGDNRELITTSLTLNQVFNIVLNGFYTIAVMLKRMD